MLNGNDAKMGNREELRTTSSYRGDLLADSIEQNFFSANKLSCRVCPAELHPNREPMPKSLILLPRSGKNKDRIKKNMIRFALRKLSSDMEICQSR